MDGMRKHEFIFVIANLIWLPKVVLGHCDMGKFKQHRQTIQLADSGDGFTEMVTPQPDMIHIWPGEQATLYYEFSRPTIQNKVWLYRQSQLNAFRLPKVLPDENCFVIGEQNRRDPFEQTFYLRTSQEGTYMFAEYDTNWKLLKNVASHEGRNEIYIPLKTFVVLKLKPAGMGLELRLASYEKYEKCWGAQAKIEWLIKGLRNARSIASEYISQSILDGYIEGNVKREICRELSNDSTPSFIMAYYNIDRARITPEGIPLEHERPWKVIEELTITKLASTSLIRIPLPDPFGAVTRIRMHEIFLAPKDEFIITLMARSEEAMSEAFWGPGNAELPFPEEHALPYIFAQIRISQLLYREVMKANEGIVNWLLIEPQLGRIRTPTGALIAMNVTGNWEHASFLNEIIIQKRGDKRKNFKIERVEFEKPEHPEDVGAMLNLVHTERPLHEAGNRFNRACMAKVHGFATSSYYVNLEDPKLCAENDRDHNEVYKRTPSVRSDLISYTAQLLYDDFGDGLAQATGAVFGHIQVVSYSRTSRELITNMDVECAKRRTQDGETFRLGWVVDRLNESVQYLSRWEDRWVRYYGDTNQVSYINLTVKDEPEWGADADRCPPQRFELDFVYDLDTHNLRVVTNDTLGIIIDMKLEKHPIWLGFEVFVDTKQTRCTGCFVSVQIDRRQINLNRKQQWPSIYSAINEWPRIHQPAPRDAKAIWYGWLELSQKFTTRVALTASPKNLQRRIIELLRKMAQQINVSVAMVGAAAFCPDGMYMPYGTPAVCVECPPGTRSRQFESSASFAVHVCEDCPIGTYQDTPGQKECRPCNQGQSTPNRGSWSRGACGPNVTADGMFISNTRGIPRQGQPYTMVDLPSNSEEQRYDWTKDEDEREFQNIEGPGEVNMVGTSRLVFNIFCLILLLSCVMTFVITSKGYMLIWITQKSRARKPTQTQTKSSTDPSQLPMEQLESLK